MIAIRMDEIILWKHPTAKFVYMGDHEQIKKHSLPDGTECFGLDWRSDDINKPTKAQIDSWRDDAEESYKWEDVRAERDKKLAASDKVMLSDYPIHEVGRTEWEGYRQELRDVPQSYSDADLVEWPSEPNI